MKLAHVGFTVSDLDAAIEFFTAQLGLTMTGRQTQDNEYTRRTVGVPDAVVENVLLSDGTTEFALQLLQYRVPQQQGKFAPVQNPGSVHLAMQVADLQQFYDDALARGVQFVSPPNHIDSGRNDGGKIVYALGPDELRVELVQLPEHVDSK